MGVREPLPVLGAPEAGSLAAHAGLRAGDVVASAGESAESQTPVASFEQLRWAAVQAALAGQDLWVTLAQAPAAPSLPPVRLPLSLLDSRDADERLMHRIGLLFPYSAAVIGEIQPGAAAERAGLRTGDRVHAVDGRPVDDAHQLRQMIRQGTAPGGEPVSQRWRVQRDGQSIDIEIFPVPQRQKDGTWWGRIGAFVGAEPAMTVVRQGPWDGAVQAFRKVGEISVLSLNMMGRMVVGDASLKNLSGPLTIADHAGRSAQVGWTAYLSFLALISVSLGVLNLLPLPVLDGGHLMYYLWEGVTGRPVSEVWMDRLQRAGVVLLMGMMALALFNDLARYLG
jgi:regulator of sigma E protease